MARGLALVFSALVETLMGSRLLIPVVLLVGSAGAPAWAEECAPPDTSALHAACLAMQERDQAERTLDGLETRLRKLMSLNRTADLPPDESLMTALTAQQTAWRHYVQDECTLAGALTGSGGAWPMAYAVMCQAKLAENRSRQTQTAIDCIEKIPAEKRLFEQNQCLNELAPLAAAAGAIED